MMVRLPHSFAEARHRSAQYRASDVMAERAIALELRLVEELVGRGLVREIALLERVVHEVGRLAAVESCLDVEERADEHRAAVALRIANLADRMMRLDVAGAFGRADCRHVDFNDHAEVGVALANRVREVGELVARIASGIYIMSSCVSAERKQV